MRGPNLPVKEFNKYFFNCYQVENNYTPVSTYQPWGTKTNW